MRLLINTASTFKGGGVQVAASILNECMYFDDCEFAVVLGPGLSGIVRETDFPKNFQFFRLDYRPAQRVLSLRRSEKDLVEIESSFNPDVVFTTSGPSYWRPRAPHLMGFNLPHHLYPDSPYFTRVLSTSERLIWRAKTLAIHHYTKGFADALVVQTDDVNRRLREWVGSECVYTVPNTVSEAYREAQRNKFAGTAQQSERTDSFRLLVLSSYYRHKNLEIINDIIDLVRRRRINGIRFTMTLPDGDFAKAILPKNRAWVENVGSQCPDECPALYDKADALFLPSLLECFSANYVEAMTMMRPIITTDLGFARTICSNAALYFKPLNADDALKQILNLRDDRRLYANQVEAGQMQLYRFGTPSQRTESYLTLCRELMDQKIAQQSTD